MDDLDQKLISGGSIKPTFPVFYKSKQPFLKRFKNQNTELLTVKSYLIRQIPLVAGHIV